MSEDPQSLLIFRTSEPSPWQHNVGVLLLVLVLFFLSIFLYVPGMP